MPACLRVIGAHLPRGSSETGSVKKFVRKRAGQVTMPSRTVSTARCYAPDYRNKFVKSVCELPKVKCGVCPNQAFRPFDANAARDHLKGKHVMGVYPLLEKTPVASSPPTSTRGRGETTSEPSLRTRAAPHSRSRSNAHVREGRARMVPRGVDVLSPLEEGE